MWEGKCASVSFLPLVRMIRCTFGLLWSPRRAPALGSAFQLFECGFRHGVFWCEWRPVRKRKWWPGQLSPRSRPPRGASFSQNPLFLLLLPAPVCLSGEQLSRAVLLLPPSSLQPRLVRGLCFPPPLTFCVCVRARTCAHVRVQVTLPPTVDLNRGKSAISGLS